MSAVHKGQSALSTTRACMHAAQRTAYGVNALCKHGTACVALTAALAGTPAGYVNQERFVPCWGACPKACFNLLPGPAGVADAREGLQRLVSRKHSSDAILAPNVSSSRTVGSHARPSRRMYEIREQVRNERLSAPGPAL